MSSKKVKVVVIGGGPGGYVAAIRASQLGGEVTLVEKDHLGGTCLNIGCIPTKALLHTAEIYENAKNGGGYGVIADVKLDFTKTQKRKKRIIKRLVGGVKGLLASNGVKVISGSASFESSNSIKIKMPNGETEVLEFHKAVIAAGAVPVIPHIKGIESKSCITSTEALELKEVPETMVVLGGDVIGVEIAALYNALGSKVRIIEMQSQILPMMDGELVKIISSKLIKKGVEIYTSSRVMSIKDNGSQADVTIETDQGEKKVVTCEKVLISAGRKSNISVLELDKAGIISDKKGIIVDNRMKTNVKGIYAVGDCTGHNMSAHAASAGGEVAAENALGHENVFDIKTSPSCVYTDPEFASVGLTEKEAEEQGIEYAAARFPLAANGKSLIMGGEEGMIKLVVGKEYREILGAHIVGPRATDLISECALAIQLEATAEDIIAVIHAHPTVSEAIREAAMVVEKRAIHMPN